jgi:hypothetical protein
LKHVGLARLASYFILLVQNKVTKQKDTPCHFFLALLTITGGNQTRPNKPHKTWLAAELKQVIAENSGDGSAARRDRGDGNS